VNPTYDYAFSRMGTQFFAAPVPAMRAMRGALKPGGRLVKLCWRRKAESPLWAETEQVVQRFLSRPAEYEADTCGPGPFSLGNPETTQGILQAAGFDAIELQQATTVKAVAVRSPTPYGSTTQAGSGRTAQ
jgi:SAM-dependent methyltransferase